MILDRHVTPQAGLVMFQALPRRQRMARRRSAVIAAMAALALAAGVIGAVAHHADLEQASTPLSYFPS